MKNKKPAGLLLNVDRLKEAELLSPKEFKQLIIALRRYQEGEEIQENTLSQACRITYRMMRLDIDHNLKSFQEKCEQNRINGQKGGAPFGNQNAVKKKKNEEKPTHKPSIYLSDDTFKQIVNWYHKYCPNFPAIKRLTNTRKLKIQECLKDMEEAGFSIACFRDVFMAMGTSEYLKDKRWVRLDWVINNTENWSKIYEGMYDKLYDNPKQSEESPDIQVVSSDDYSEEGSEDSWEEDLNPTQNSKKEENAPSLDYVPQAPRFGIDPPPYSIHHVEYEDEEEYKTEDLYLEHVQNAPSFPGARPFPGTEQE